MLPRHKTQYLYFSGTGKYMCYSGRLEQTGVEPTSSERQGMEMAAVEFESLRWSADTITNSSLRLSVANQYSNLYFMVDNL